MSTEPREKRGLVRAAAPWLAGIAGLLVGWVVFSTIDNRDRAAVEAAQEAQDQKEDELRRTKYFARKSLKKWLKAAEQRSAPE